MLTLEAAIEGVGYWTRGVPSWEAAVALVREGIEPVNAPARPSPQLLAPNERRRAPETVAVALDVALAACVAAGREPATLPSVFTSTHGDMAITDYMCATLADDPRAISPTKFHNSVHNAAAGYWTIGAGAMEPATAVSAHRFSFAQGLLEALVQRHANGGAILLVGYDSEAIGPLRFSSSSRGLLGGALVLGPPVDARPRLQLTLEDGPTPLLDGVLTHQAHGNAMLPMLPLFDALAAGGRATVLLPAGADRRLRLEISNA